MQYKSLIFLDPLSVNPLKDFQFSRDSINFSWKRSLRREKREKRNPAVSKGVRLKARAGREEGRVRSDIFRWVSKSGPRNEFVRPSSMAWFHCELRHAKWRYDLPREGRARSPKISRRSFVNLKFPRLRKFIERIRELTHSHMVVQPSLNNG